MKRDNETHSAQQSPAQPPFSKPSAGNMGAAVQRIAWYLLLLSMSLAAVVLVIIAEPTYSYNSSAYANSLALFVMWGLIVAGVWFNIVWESENDD